MTKVQISDVDYRKPFSSFLFFFLTKTIENFPDFLYASMRIKD